MNRNETITETKEEHGTSFMDNVGDEDDKDKSFEIDGDK
jgi:hypothetical protein